MSFHRGRGFRKEDFPELKFVRPGQSLPRLRRRDGRESAAGKRQARHETETERIAGLKEHYWDSTGLRGPGARGAPVAAHRCPWPIYGFRTFLGRAPNPRQPFGGVGFFDNNPRPGPCERRQSRVSFEMALRLRRRCAEVLPMTPSRVFAVCATLLVLGMPLT